MRDAIVEEVREIRGEIAQECGFDLHRIMQHASDTAAKIEGLRYVTLDEMKARRVRQKAARDAYRFR